MKKIFIIPLLFLASHSLAQTDTALGKRGAYIPLVPLSIPSNYLIVPNSHTFYFDSSKVGVSLQKNSTRDSIRLMSGSGSVLATVKDSTGGGGLNDTTFLPITTNGLGTTQDFSKGFQVRTYTPATSGNQQISGMYRWTGQGFNPSTSTSQPVDIFADLLPVQNNTPLGYLRFGFRSNNGTVTNNILTIGYSTTGTPGVGINAVPQGTSGAALNVGGNIALTSVLSFSGTPALNSFGANWLDLTSGLLRLFSNPTVTYNGITLARATSIGKSTIATPGAILDVDYPGMAFLPPRGTQAQRDSINLQVSSITITNAGTGYTSAPSASFTAGPLSNTNNAAINVVVSGGSITGYSITASGHYNNTPTITLSGGGGTGGALTPVMTQVLTVGMTYYCTNCTATDSSTGVMQTWNGSTWKNNW